MPEKIADKKNTISKIQNNFLTGMSHELRTPLNAIIGFTGTLLMKLPGPLTPDQEKQLKIVDSSARHLLHVINNLLHLAALESGKFDLNFEKIDTFAFTQKTLESLKNYLIDKDFKLDVTKVTPHIHLQTDKKALSQILSNLLINSFTCNQEGDIIISSGEYSLEDKPYYKWSISDKRSTETQPQEEKIFLESEEMESLNCFKGSALELLTCYKLAKCLGGHLKCENFEDGKHIISLFLPLSYSGN